MLFLLFYNSCGGLGNYTFESTKVLQNQEAVIEIATLMKNILFVYLYLKSLDIQVIKQKYIN